LRLHPPLCLQMALFKLFPHEGRADCWPEPVAEVEQLLQEAEAVWQAEGNRSGLGQILAFRALLFGEQADGARAAHLARQALDYLADTDQQWRGSCLGRMGVEELQAGRAREARRLFQAARTAFDSAGNALGARAVLHGMGEACFLEGALRQAAAFYREVNASAGEDHADRARALLGQARLSYEWNKLETARQEAEEALALSTRLGDETVYVQASLILAQIERAQGGGSAAQQRLQALLAQVSTGSMPYSSLLSQYIQTSQARFALAAGDLLEAERWFTTRPTTVEGMPRLRQEQADLLEARLLVARGQTQEALDLLGPWRSEAHTQGRIRSEIESLILMALACMTAGNSSEAISLLTEGLALARAEGYQRLFLDEGAELVALLHAVLSTLRGDPLAPYVRLLVYASAESSLDQSASLGTHGSGAPFPLAPLSPQEQRVFRLLGAGYSNPEIAKALVVSLNTVKTQVRSIYQKLNVQNRKEARALLRS
jgi:LuxR family transcriptional regulator, maltose regulon positive regulatory protein